MSQTQSWWARLISSTVVFVTMFGTTSPAKAQNCYQVFCYEDACCPMLFAIECGFDSCPPIIMINDDVSIEEHTERGWFGDEFSPIWDYDGCVYLKPKCNLSQDPPCEYSVQYIPCRQASSPSTPFDCPPPP